MKISFMDNFMKFHHFMKFYDSRFWQGYAFKIKCFNVWRRLGKQACKANFAVDYDQDTLAPLYIQSTKALVTGFFNALRAVCGTNARSKCPGVTSKFIVATTKNVSNVIIM
jgi:hypothetical protein